MADPKDPQTPVIEEEVVETPPVETPPEAPEPPVEEVVEEAPEEPEEPEEKPPSRREQLRIQDILAKREKAQQPTPPASAGLNYATDLNAEPEIVKQLEADRQAAANASYQAGIKQADSIRWEALLNADAPTIETKYPQLDKTSSDFHPALANAINSMYLSSVGYDADNKTVTNPNIRYRDYVESVFELANEIAGEKIQSTTTNIKKQVANTGLRPDGSTSKRLNLNQSPNQMTPEELEAKIKSDFAALGL